MQMMETLSGAVNNLDAVLKLTKRTPVPLGLKKTATGFTEMPHLPWHTDEAAHPVWKVLQSDFRMRGLCYHVVRRTRSFHQGLSSLQCPKRVRDTPLIITRARLQILTVRQNKSRTSTTLHVEVALCAAVRKVKLIS